MFVRYLSYQPPAEQKAPVDLGEASNYPPGSITMLPEIPVLLLHTAGGFTALDTTCTHLGCQLHLEEAGLVCPCHGSQFDLEGEPTKGLPPGRSHHWRVEETRSRAFDPRLGTKLPQKSKRILGGVGGIGLLACRGKAGTIWASNIIFV